MAGVPRCFRLRLGVEDLLPRPQPSFLREWECEDRPASFMHRGGGGQEQTLRNSATNMEKATLCGAEEILLVSKRKSSGSIIWRWFGYKSSDEQQNRTARVRCAAARRPQPRGPAAAVPRGGSRNAPRWLSRPLRTGRVEEEMVGLDITTIKVQSNITTAGTRDGENCKYS